MDRNDYRKYWPDLLETMTACSISGRVSIERARALAFDLSILLPWCLPRETKPLVLVCIPVPRTNREFLFPIVEHPVFIGYRTRRYAPPCVWWTLDTSSSLKIFSPTSFILRRSRLPLIKTGTRRECGQIGIGLAIVFFFFIFFSLFLTTFLAKHEEDRDGGTGYGLGYTGFTACVVFEVVPYHFP